MQDIEGAVALLKEHIRGVHTVVEWADLMGFSCKDYFARKIRKAHRKTAYTIIKETKLELIKSELAYGTEAKFFAIALDLGFADNNAMYKFIKCHTGLTPTELREQVRNGSQKWESEMGVRNGSQKWELERSSLYFKRLVYIVN